MSLRILAAASPGEIRVAAVRGQSLVDYALWRPGSPDGLGDLHRGRIGAVVPAIAGAFVILGSGAEGFLPDSAGARGLGTGDAVSVRVTRSAQGGKGVRLRADLSPEEISALGAAAVLRGSGPLLEVAARFADAPVVVDDPLLAAHLRPAFGDRLMIAAAAFDDAVEAEVEALADRAAPLPGGMRALIHPTPALVAIDVDAGAATAERRAKPAAQRAANQAMLPELARQIRLRNLSGAILIDLAGLAIRRRAALGPALAEALAEDPLQPRLLGFTALGFAEILRPRGRPPLHELLAGPLAAGLAALRRVAAESATRPGWTPALRATPAIVTALETDGTALPDLARRAGRPLILRSDPMLAPLRWVLEE